MSGDLHCHTRLSNGSMGIEEIIDLAKARGVTTIAITDHDCLAGTVRGKIIGARNGIKVLPGVELSSLEDETEDYMNILCYLPDYPDRLEGLCHKNTAVRKRASQYIMIKTAQRYPVTPELMKRCATGSTNLFKQHIMHALMECGVADSIYGKVHDELFSPESKTNILMKPKYAKVSEVIDTIHAAGGIAVLSHPALYDSFKHLDKLVKIGLDGVEVWHPTADEETVNKLIVYAKAHKLLMTGGSDFHGLYNKQPISIGDYVTPKPQLTELLGYKAKKKRLEKKISAAEDKAGLSQYVRRSADV